MFEHIVGKHKCDIFIHTWSKMDHRSEEFATEHGGWDDADPNEIADVYSPVDLVIEQTPFQGPPGMSPSSMFRKAWLADEMRRRWSERTGIIHDVVFRMRPDLLFLDAFPWNDFDPAHLHIPHGEDHGGINDQIAYGPAALVSEVCSFGSVAKDDHPETSLKKHIESRGLSPRRPVVKYRIVRLAEADSRGFIKRKRAPIIASLPTTTPIEERPTEPESPLARVARPMRAFWTPDRYAGNRDGIEHMGANIIAGIDEPGVGLIVEAIDRTRSSIVSKFKSLGWVYPFKHDDLHLDVPDSSFDTVVLLSMQHVPSHAARQTIIDECFRAIKSNGNLCMQMGFGTDRFTPYRSEDLLKISSLAHVSLTDPEDLIGDLRRAGFDDFEHRIVAPGAGDGHDKWIFVRAKKPAQDLPSGQATDLSTHGSAPGAPEA